MATDFAGSSSRPSALHQHPNYEWFADLIPAAYGDIFAACSCNGEPVDGEVFRVLLAQCKLDEWSLQTIWSLVGGPAGVEGGVNRTMVYKTLALVAWAQQGITISGHSFENYAGEQFPVPQVGDLHPVRLIKLRIAAMAHPSALSMTYADVVQLDAIRVDLVAQRRGRLLMKHAEFVVASRRFGSRVMRRYNDFIAFHELLVARFPYRLVPRLPPKRIISNTHLLEARRRGLQRWLTLVCRHPTMCHDSMVAYFLLEPTATCEMQYTLRKVYRNAPDEFMISEYAATAKNLVPPKAAADFATQRDHIRTMVQIVNKLKRCVEYEANRMTAGARNATELATQLQHLGDARLAMPHVASSWPLMQKGFMCIANELFDVSHHTAQTSNVQKFAIGERLALLLDILIAHRDLCDRLERCLLHDHQTALQKMCLLKKKKHPRGVDIESAPMETKMLVSEEIVANMELRSDFSMYCAHMELQLVGVYMETLCSIMNSMVSLHVRSHSEISCCWNQITPMMQHYLPADEHAEDARNSQSVAPPI